MAHAVFNLLYPTCECLNKGHCRSWSSAVCKANIDAELKTCEWCGCQLYKYGVGRRNVIYTEWWYYQHPVKQYNYLTTLPLSLSLQLKITHALFDDFPSARPYQWEANAKLHEWRSEAKGADGNEFHPARDDISWGNLFCSSPAGVKKCGNRRGPQVFLRLEESFCAALEPRKYFNDSRWLVKWLKMFLWVYCVQIFQRNVFCCRCWTRKSQRTGSRQSCVQGRPSSSPPTTNTCWCPRSSSACCTSGTARPPRSSCSATRRRRRRWTSSSECSGRESDSKNTKGQLIFFILSMLPYNFISITKSVKILM